VYRGLAIPPGTPDAVASHAKDSLAAAIEAARTLSANEALGLLTAAKSAFTDGLAIAAGVGSALLLASAVAVWLLMKPTPTPAGTADVRTPDDPAMHRDASGDCVDAGTAEVGSRHCRFGTGVRIAVMDQPATGGTLCSKLNTFSGSYLALTWRSRTRLDP
jgi:DHA2 family multidrug resistance protein-like MFS transporter